MEQHQPPAKVTNTAIAMRVMERSDLELIRLQHIRLEHIRTQGYHADEVPYNTVSA